MKYWSKKLEVWQVRGRPEGEAKDAGGCLHSRILNSVFLREPRALLTGEHGLLTLQTLTATEAGSDSGKQSDRNARRDPATTGTSCFSFAVACRILNKLTHCKLKYSSHRPVSLYGVLWKGQRPCASRVPQGSLQR